VLLILEIWQMLNKYPVINSICGYHLIVYPMTPKDLIELGFISTLRELATDNQLYFRLEIWLCKVNCSKLASDRFIEQLPIWNGKELKENLSIKLMSMAFILLNGNMFSIIFFLQKKKYFLHIHIHIAILNPLLKLKIC